MSLLNTISFITSHPLNRGQRLRAIGRFGWWQTVSRLSDRPRILPFVENSCLVVRRGQTGATGNIYTGLHELTEMAFVLHALRPSDLFVDVGANVGSYTILAAAAVGSRCISFEPDPSAFEGLTANIDANQVTARVETHRAAVGASSGIVRFSRDHDTLGHVVPEGEIAVPFREVPIVTLDETLAGRVPAAIKIDVEGFETAVLKGAARTLADPALKAVIAETNGSGERYDSTDAELNGILGDAGFSPCIYDPFSRTLARTSTFTDGANTIYVRDFEQVAARLREARAYDIAGRWLL